MATHLRVEHAAAAPASLGQEVRALQDRTYEYAGSLAHRGATVVAEVVRGFWGHQVSEPIAELHRLPDGVQGPVLPPADTTYTLDNLHYGSKRMVAGGMAELSMIVTSMSAMRYRRLDTSTGYYEPEPSSGSVALEFGVRRSGTGPKRQMLPIHEYGPHGGRGTFEAVLSAENSQLGRMGLTQVPAGELALLEEADDGPRITRVPVETETDGFDRQGIRDAYASRYAGQIVAAASLAHLINEFTHTFRPAMTRVELPDGGPELLAAWHDVSPDAVDHMVVNHGLRTGLLSPAVAEQLGLPRQAV